MSSEPTRERLPFEPAKTRKKTPKKPAESIVTPPEKPEKPSNPEPGKGSTNIPEGVSRRMIARMGVFSGIPTGLGILTFVGSYFVVKNQVFPLATSAVVLVSMALFGIGVLGLSYGALSASWDEETPGSKLGWHEFNTNWTRMREAWRSAKSKR
jgi:hypothetical protein